MMMSLKASKPWLVLIAVLAVVFAVFAPSLSADFVNWDDTVHVYENSLVRSLDARSIGEMFRARVGGVYIPLTLLSFAVEYKFFGYDPFVYPLDNLILHLWVVALVFGLARRLGLGPWTAAAGALLFGIHPMHVESVAWVTERKDVLYSFFYLWALYVYLGPVSARGSELGVLRKDNRDLRRATSYEPRVPRMIAVTLLGILSLLAKPMAISLPAILILLDWFKGRKLTRQVLGEKLPLIAAAAVIGWMTYQVYARVPGESFGQGLLVWCWTLVFYIRQFLFPIFYVTLYRLPAPIELMNPQYVLSLATAVLLAASVVLFRRSKWFIFAATYFFFSIVFLLRFDVYDTNAVADRFMYLPSLGVCLWLAVVMEKLFCRAAAVRPWGRAAVIAGMCALLLFLGGMARRQCRVWHNSISLWEHQLSIYPKEKVALNNLANAYRQDPGYKSLIEQYRQAKAGERKFSPAAREAAVSLVKRVAGLFVAARRLDHDYLPPLYNLAYFFKDLGEYRLSAAKFQEYLKIDPFDHEVHLYLGEVYVTLGDPGKAEAHFDRAVALVPEDMRLYEEIIRVLNEAARGEGQNKDAFERARGRFFRLYKQRYHILSRKDQGLYYYRY